MAQLPEFDRSYAQVLLYPPQPAAMVEYEGRQFNFSAKMYGIYAQQQRHQMEARGVLVESFLEWHRGKEYDTVNRDVHHRGGKYQPGTGPTEVMACRYWYELTDGYSAILHQRRPGR